MGIFDGIIAGGISAGASMYNNWQNIQFQEEQNAINRAREDNAVQRRARDMEAAGINPLLAAGSPAQASAMPAPRLTENVGKSAVEGYLRAQNIAQTQASAELTKEQARSAKIDNDIKQQRTWEQVFNEDGSVTLSPSARTVYENSMLSKYEADTTENMLRTLRGTMAKQRAGYEEATKEAAALFLWKNRDQLNQIEFEMKRQGLDQKEIETRTKAIIENMLKVDQSWQQWEKGFGLAGKLTGMAAQGMRTFYPGIP